MLHGIRTTLGPNYTGNVCSFCLGCPRAALSPRHFSFFLAFLAPLLDGSGFSNVFWDPWLILRKESERSTIIMISYSVCSVVFCNTNIGLIFMFQMSQAS